MKPGLSPSSRLRRSPEVPLYCEREMNIKLSLLYLLLAGATALAQTPANSPSAPARVNAPSVGSAPTVPVLPDLDRLQTAASQATLDLGRLRIDKWKADADSKQQAQANADSVRRNLTSALPGLIAAVRSAPQDLGAEFKLYRNLNALYDVFASLTEATGAFGPKGDYEALAQQLVTFDSVRRTLGDALWAKGRLRGVSTATRDLRFRATHPGRCAGAIDLLHAVRSGPAAGSGPRVPTGRGG